MTGRGPLYWVVEVVCALIIALVFIAVVSGAAHLLERAALRIIRGLAVARRRRAARRHQHQTLRSRAMTTTRPPYEPPHLLPVLDVPADVDDGQGAVHLLTEAAKLAHRQRDEARRQVAILEAESAGLADVLDDVMRHLMADDRVTVPPRIAKAATVALGVRRDRIFGRAGVPA